MRSQVAALGQRQVGGGDHLELGKTAGVKLRRSPRSSEKSGGGGHEKFASFPVCGCLNLQEQRRLSARKNTIRPSAHQKR